MLAIWPSDDGFRASVGPARPIEGHLIMGYGFGVFLLAVGLILALAVQDAIAGIDLVLVGWIVAAAGVLIVLLTAVTLNSRRRSSAVSTTTYADGAQATTHRRNDEVPPAV